jgi:3-hydroxybutyryl-CoA dehydratase
MLFNQKGGETMLKGLTMQEISVGDSADFSKTITETDIVLFAGISGDFNPVHINAEEAKSGMFGQRIAHGMLSASFISNAIGNKLPGPGTIYLSQELKFVKPVYIGDTVTAIVTVAEKLEEKNRLKLSTTVVNQNNENVIVGSALVIPPRSVE